MRIEDDEEKFIVYSINCVGVNQNSRRVAHEVFVAIPKVDKKYGRILEVEGSSGTRYRVVAHRAFGDLLSETFVPDLSVVHWQLTIINALNDAISDALLDCHFDGSRPFRDSVQQRFQNWLNTAPHILDIDPDNEMKVRSACEAIMLQVSDEMMSHNGRIYDESWLGKIDPTSTPTSNKINLVYRLAKGASIKAGKIITGESIFCSTVADNCIASVLNPRRGYLFRTTFENSVKLVSPEKPKIKSVNNTLDGVHLLTAVMHYGVQTFEDAILISASAAQKLGCYVNKRITFRSRGPITRKACIGDIVMPGQILAESDGGESDIRASKIVKPAEIVDIEEYRVVHHGYVHNAVRFHLRNVYAATPGDKLSNRGSGKGVINILPDAMMPRTEDGRIIECCVAPEGLAGRRVMALYWEMMAHKAIDAGETINPSLSNPTAFSELARKYGHKEQLYLHEAPLPDKTFIGEIFWIRINKHACEMNSAVGEKRVLTKTGTLVDDARTSGQRIDIGKTMAFHDREILPILDDSIKGSCFGNPVVRDYVKALTP